MWDKFFLEGLQSGIEMGLKRKALKAEKEFKDWSKKYQEAELATKGIRIDENGNPVRDESLMSPMDKFLQQGQVADTMLKLAQLGINPMQGGQQGVVPGGAGIPSAPSPMGSLGQRFQQQGGQDLMKSPYIPEKLNALGNPTGYQLNPLIMEQEKAAIRGKAKGKEAEKKAVGNFGRVAGAVKQYANYYAEALKEGGVGNWYKREKGKLITQQVGGGIGERMTGTGKLYGQRAELSLAMVPILTNQNRFMSSIMDYINQSLPQGHEGAKMAAGKLEQTLLNQYTTTKVLARLGYDPDNPEDVSKIDVMNDEEAVSLSEKVIGMAKTYKLSKEEQKEFDEINKDILDSLRNYKSGGTLKSGLTYTVE